MATTFTGTRVTQLRQRARKAAKCPEDPPEGWSVSTVDPMAVLAVFEPLKIKEGYILRAYQFREGGNGNGFVWAISAEADFPDPENSPRLMNFFLEPPKPPSALMDYMDAIDGDGTPWSYMCASLLARELAEFGAMWHGCDWSTHQILGSNPWRRKRSTNGKTCDMSPRSYWTWNEPAPTAWRPQVSEGESTVVVTFFTYSALGQETIYRNTDTYTRGRYSFKADRTDVAGGVAGFVF